MKPVNQAIQISESSLQARFGLKGGNTLAFLQANQINVPAKANQWLMHQNGLLLRLGNSEFLFEPADGQAPTWFSEVTAAPEVYRVPRADAVFTLTGNGCDDLLAEICALDLTALFTADPQAVLMTSIAGISAILIRQTVADQSMVYRIWCDASYGSYLQKTLCEIAKDISSTVAARAGFP